MPVILHIGMQKTGTSALQYFFHSNGPRLAQDGLSYPRVQDFDDITFQGVSYHNCLAGTIGRLRSAFPAMSDEGLAAFQCHLREAKDRVILSGEDFSRSIDLTGIADFFEGIETTVIVYLRNQVAWAQSLYNQRNKLLLMRGDKRILEEGVLTHEDLFDFLKTHRYVPLLHYDRLVKKWVHAFGRANVVVRTFPPEIDLTADFMATIGVTDLEGYAPPPRVNDNISNGWISFLRDLAGLIGEDAAMTVGGKLLSFASAGTIDISGKTSVLPPAVIKRMTDDYRDGNRWVAQEFLDREELF